MHLHTYSTCPVQQTCHPCIVCQTACIENKYTIAVALCIAQPLR